MLVACFVGDKQKDEENAKAEIVKYVDRLWLDERGSITCIRTVVVRVLADSEAPLRSLIMLTPFHQDRISNPEDKTSTLLLPASDHYFNSRVKGQGGFIIQNKSEESGVLNYDGMTDVEVEPLDTVSVVSVADASFFQVNFDRPVVAGAIRAFRLQFDVSDVAQEKFSRAFAIELPYFRRHVTGGSLEQAINVLQGRSEIQALPILDDDLHGGFDVSLCLPQGMQATGFQQAEQRLDPIKPDGSKGDPCEKYVFRMRKMIPPQRKSVRLDDGFTVVGFYGPPVEEGLAALDKRLRGVGSTITQANATAKASLIASVFALGASVVALILRFA